MNQNHNLSNGKSSRLFYIDHLRTFLMILVVLHHIALVYGASLPGYYYVEPPFTDPLAFRDLLIFVLLNQSWFMGAFFLLAGYFTPGSFDRKGAGAFIKDRLLRLGIPLVVFSFVLNPIAFLGYYLMPAELTGITTPLTWEVFWRAYPNFIGLGPLWFVAMLLVFSFGYFIWRMLTSARDSTAAKISVPSYLGMGIFILVLAGVSYLWRMLIPLGKSVWQFPTLAYLPQYLSFFVIGLVAFRKDWLRAIPGSTGFVGLVIAALAMALLFPWAFSGQMFSLELTDALDGAFGKGAWQSVVYALWDSSFAVCLSLGMLTFFRRFINGGSKFGGFLAQHSYAVYIIHIPIVVFMAYTLRGIELESIQKFALASAIIVPSCFIAAFLVRKIPGVSKII